MNFGTPERMWLRPGNDRVEIVWKDKECREHTVKIPTGNLRKFAHDLLAAAVVIDGE